MRCAAALIVAMLMMAALAACGGTNDDVSNDTAPKRDNSYTIILQKYTDDEGTVDIEYPQISGLYDEKMQDYYNALFKSKFEEYMGGGNAEHFLCEYEVTLKTADVLSIVFRCQLPYASPYPRGYAYAYNIDLETGETFVPSNEINTDKASRNFASGDNWEIVYSPDENYDDKESYIECYEEQSVSSAILESDVITVTRNAEGEYSKSGAFECRSYLDSNSEPVVILEVLHIVGDYIEIKFN